MTWSKFGKVVGVIAPVVAILAGLLSIADHGATLGSVAEWLYPRGVIALLAIGLVVVTGLYVDELRRPWKKLRPTKEEAERKERAAEQERRDSERQKINLIKGEIAANRRLLESGVGKQQIVQTTTEEYWVAHRLSLA